MDLFGKIMKKEASLSKNIAKERLRLVLVNDRSIVSPQLMENLKEEIIQVISGYMDVDQAHTEVILNSDDNQCALIASIPVVRIRRTTPV